jgi:hypothetical protein
LFAAMAALMLPSVPRQHFAAGLARVNTDRYEICRSARLVLI